MMILEKLKLINSCMTKKIKFSNELEKILASMLMYEKPDFFVGNFKDKIDKEKTDKKKFKKYNMLFSDINYFYKKIIKYEVYFNDFYPATEKITDIEALEYHIYAYLQDITILKNKLIVFLNCLKKDLKAIASNKKEVNNFFEEFVDKIHEIFKNAVKKNRNPHHHNGFRFLVGDLIDANMCSRMLQDDFLLKDRVNVDFVQKRKIECFKNAKKDYIEIANKNSKQITGLINTIFEKNEAFIYEVLRIKSVEEIIDFK